MNIKERGEEEEKSGFIITNQLPLLYTLHYSFLDSFTLPGFLFFSAF